MLSRAFVSPLSLSPCPCKKYMGSLGQAYREPAPAKFPVHVMPSFTIQTVGSNFQGLHRTLHFDSPLIRTLLELKLKVWLSRGRCRPKLITWAEASTNLYTRPLMVHAVEGEGRERTE